MTKLNGNNGLIGLSNTSRRGFLKSATALGIASTGIGAMASSAYANTPKRGGTFRFGIHDGNTSDSHDPGTYTTRHEPPQVNWSAPMFRKRRTKNGKQATKAGRDSFEVTAS